MTKRAKPRLADVAMAAGVSSATASRALAQPELVAADTLNRVITSAKALGYRPDAAARTLASGRSMTIGAIMPTLHNEIFSRALQSMHAVLAAAGYQLLVASHDYNPQAETEAMRMLLARGVDGLMLVGAERSPDGDALVREARVPVVLSWRANANQPAVTVNNERAGWLAAQHLIDLGHRRIGMITGRTTFNDRQKARLEGARACLTQAGLSLPDWLTSQQPTTLAGGRSGCAALLELADPPTAVIGGIDLIAIGCIVEAQARGLKVPGELSIVGIDDLDMSAHLSPSVTTVHIPTARIGTEAAYMLLRAIQEDRQPEAIELPVELVIRRSTSRLSIWTVNSNADNR